MSEAVRSVEIVNKRGLHARASAKFVKLATEFDAEVRVSRDGTVVDARSIMGLMMLAAGPGCTIDIEAEVRVSKDGQTVDARSIMGLMMLAAAPGCCIDIEADGDQATEAVDALVQLVAAKFEEDE